ncbi:MAG: hypothetical protein HeimC3_02320 [Candidatus Heimdallarchaeota archaeon LC_3]|nr:MAG: hypothetical protein HeimC3_02320 [Candidatus Heimdallarchaeota archaeon LC_3]
MMTIFSKFFLKIRKKRRGVTRTIDFTIAFSLFIIIYVQFLLVIININFLVNTGDQQDNPAQDLAERILTKPGFSSDGFGPDWASSTNIPEELGLLSTDSTYSNSFIDLNKLARLNSDLQNFQSSAFVPYSWINLASRSDLGLSEELNNIRITTRAFFNVSVSSIGGTSVTVSVKSYSSNLPLNGIDVVYSVYDFSAQTWLENGSATTIADGSVTFSSSFSTPLNPYMILAYAESPQINYIGEVIPLWGFGWTTYQPVGTIQLGQLSSYATENNSFINHSVIQSDPSQTVVSQSFFPIRNSTNPTNNLTLISGNITINSGEVNLASKFNSGTNPMFVLGFFNSSPNDFRYQISSLPMMFYEKDLSSSGLFQFPSFAAIETSDFGLFESENRFTNHFVYEQIVFSRRGAFILKIEVASL